MVSLPDRNDTIAAPATPPGLGCRAVVRLTGPQAFTIASHLLGASETSAMDWSQRGIMTVAIPIEAGRRPLTADLFHWPAERSLTGQPLVEWHLPVTGPLSTYLVRRLVSAGARLAQPGEFTLRAFLAGRIDLAEAEALGAIFAAEDHAALAAAVDQRAAGLGRRVLPLRHQLADLLADLEAGLDFADEGIELVSAEEVTRRLSEGLTALDAALDRCRIRTVSDSRPRVVLVGPPNMGKSSLLNALAGGRYALVSPHAGTTRDTVSVTVNLGDTTIELVDTAGELTESSHELPSDLSTTDPFAEPAATQRTRSLLNADLVLRCLSVTSRISFPETRPAYEIAIRTMSDLAPGFRDPLADVHVSVHDLARDGHSGSKENPSLEELRRLMAGRLDARRRCDTPPLWTERCAECLRRARQALQEALEVHRQSAGDEYVALALRDAVNELGALAGIVYTDDLLDRIFARFCIGK